MNRREFLKAFFVLLFSGKLFKVIAAEKKYRQFESPGFVLPIMHRVYPEELAVDLMAVQPMTKPTGSIFWLEKKEI